MRSGRAARSVAARVAVLLALLSPAAAVPPAHAQSANDPQLVFAIYGGLSEGGDLWRLPRQALAVTGTTQQDTVAVARRLRPGLVAGLVTTYFRSRHFGWSADIAYFGIGSEQRCDSVSAYVQGPQGENGQVCTSANSEHVGTNVVGFLGGITYRFAPEGRVQPFVRVTAGPGLLGNTSYVETTGGFTNTTTCQLGCAESILADPDRKTITWVVNLAAGITVWLAPAYRLRMEARDIITQLPTVTGPRTPFNSATPPPTGSVVKHLPTLLFGVDIVLERRHARRY